MTFVWWIVLKNILTQKNVFFCMIGWFNKWGTNLVATNFVPPLCSAICPIQLSNQTLMVKWLSISHDSRILFFFSNLASNWQLVKSWNAFTFFYLATKKNLAHAHFKFLFVFFKFGLEIDGQYFAEFSKNMFELNCFAKSQKKIVDSNFWERVGCLSKRRGNLFLPLKSDSNIFGFE